MDLVSPYLWRKGSWAKPLVDTMGITHRGRSLAVERALSDFGIEGVQFTDVGNWAALFAVVLYSQ